MSDRSVLLVFVSISKDIISEHSRPTSNYAPQIESYRCCGLLGRFLQEPADRSLRAAASLQAISAMHALILHHDTLVWIFCIDVPSPAEVVTSLRARLTLTRND